MSGTGIIAFGNEIAAEGPEADDNPYRFSTKYSDAEAGLYHYGFRYGFRYGVVWGRTWRTI